MKKLLTAVLLASLAACGGSEAPPQPPPAGVAVAGTALLSATGERNELPGGGWFTWKFAEKPKLGTMIVKVQVFNAEGKQETTCALVGESGMPSMPYHDSGPVKFQLNKKGDYLLPVDVVMPGEWAVVIRVRRNAKELYAGKVLFNI